MPRIRAEPEDFLVEELPLYPASGHGTHTHLWIEKRLQTTDAVVRELARCLGLPAREVGYAGRKDRRAVTRQWFSVPELDPAVATALDFGLPGVRVLEAMRHPHKLRVGQLEGNRFRLLVREVDAGAADSARRRLVEIARRGLPNRFGQQRFGHANGNVARGAEILRQGFFRGPRSEALLMVSALQSAVFNQVLDARVTEIDRLIQGDVAVTHATGGHFVVMNPEREQERATRFEISPTGPIFGPKMQRPRAAAAELEDAAMAELGLPLLNEIRPPRALRMPGKRRPLRIQVEGVDCEWREDEAALRLEFELPAGSYATVLVEELFSGDVEEGMSASKDSLVDADESH